MEENKQAVLLLCAHFSSPKTGDPTPLTALEYGRFAFWLKEKSLEPQDLFHRFDELCEGWTDPKGKITRERLRFLLGRGMAMALALEKWQSAGIWFISRSDPEYPSRLKKLLGVAAPAVLFGVGNKRLLNAGGLAIIGSRNINDDDKRYTATIARQAAMEGLNVVSGGARGVDETAMMAALEVDGTALGILANDLLKAAIANKWRRYIKANQLVLTSPFYPEARFQVGNAMGRNKYIYCLSEYALAVRSEKEKGGTWSGAKENLRNDWVPMFVQADSKSSGNVALQELGALPLAALDSGDQSQAEWLLAQLKSKPAPEQEGTKDIEEVEEPDERDTDDAKSSPEESEDGPETQFQGFVELVLQQINDNGEVTLAQLKEIRTDLRQKQITDWLDQAAEEGVIERKGRRRTYVLKSDEGEQMDIFS